MVELGKRTARGEANAQCVQCIRMGNELQVMKLNIAICDDGKAMVKAFDAYEANIMAETV